MKLAPQACIAAWVWVAACDAPPPPPEPTDCTATVGDEPFEPMAHGETPRWEPHPWVGDPRDPGGGIDTGFWFPAQIGLERSAYPTLEGEDVVMRVIHRVGALDNTHDISMLLLVEGQVAELVYEGSVSRRIDRPLPADGELVTEVAIRAPSLRPGLNRVDLLTFVHRNGGIRGIIGPTFSVANGSFDPPSHADTPGLESGTYVPETPTRIYRTFAHPDAPPGETRFNLWTPAHGILESPTPVVLRIQASSPLSRCEPWPSYPDEVMLVAFRDMEPVPMGDVENVFVTLPRGEQRVFRFDWVPDFPPGEFHHYAIFELIGFSRPARVPETGGLARWSATRDITQIFWGWSHPDAE